MNKNHQLKDQAGNFEQEGEAMFSVDEAESHYLISLDIPTIPSLAVQVLRTKDALLVEGMFADSGQMQTVFQCRPQGKGIQASYKNGVLWLMLPKQNYQNANAQLHIA